LRDLVHYAIIGHSERRYKFGESLSDVKAKVAACVRNDIVPILCVGETGQERDDKETKQVLHDQVTTALANLTAREVGGMVLAYEPVWALSTGTDYLHHPVPKPDEIATAIKYIRDNVAHLYGERVAKRVRVLYGGSVNASSARGLLETDGVDGLLIGGASLNYHEFSNIIAAADRSLAEGKQSDE
jgi:triosephosphate isomerase